uniref:Uncharacterized protein n=1 Tax=Romanomermis culicivorax TaxID=13658 RepID=A0A915KRY3_ROMCU
MNKEHMKNPFFASKLENEHDYQNNRLLNTFTLAVTVYRWNGKTRNLTGWCGNAVVVIGLLQAQNGRGRSATQRLVQIITSAVHGAVEGVVAGVADAVLRRVALLHGGATFIFVV